MTQPQRKTLKQRLVGALTGASGDDQTEENFGLVQEAGETDEAFAARVEVAATEAEAANMATAAAAEAEAAAAAKAKAEEDAKAAAAEADKKQFEAAAKLQAARKAAEDAAALDMVDVIVPKKFVLTLDDGSKRVYLDGTYAMPRSHAEHWWSKGNGVKIYIPVKK